MFQTFKRIRYPRSGNRHIVPDSMGYPRSDYNRYDPYQEDNMHDERKGNHELEGAGRQGWDYDQNRAYAYVYGNHHGSTSNDGRREIRNHRGKGPRNYRRADERIVDDIIDLISARGIDASDVEIRIDQGEVTLSGNVAARQSRRVLEDIVEGVKGVRHVDNCIRVKHF